MSGFLWAVIGVVGTLVTTVTGDMVSEEIRDRLDHAPQAILHLAARRLDPAQRLTVYDEEWMPELTFILKGDDARPITRLYHGTRYAVGILAVSGRLAKQLRHTQAAPVQKKLEGLRANLRLAKLLATQRFQSIPRPLVVAVVPFAVAVSVPTVWLFQTYVAEPEWLRNIMGGLGLCMIVISVFLAFRHRARIRALLRASTAAAFR